MSMKKKADIARMDLLILAMRYSKEMATEEELLQSARDFVHFEERAKAEEASTRIVEQYVNIDLFMVVGSNASGQEKAKKLYDFMVYQIERGKHIVLNLDDIDTYSTRFFVDAIGGLVKKYGIQDVKKKVSYVSTRRVWLVDEIGGWMRMVHNDDFENVPSWQ